MWLKYEQNYFDNKFEEIFTSHTAHLATRVSNKQQKREKIGEKKLKTTNSFIESLNELIKRINEF